MSGRFTLALAGVLTASACAFLAPVSPVSAGAGAFRTAEEPSSTEPPAPPETLVPVLAPANPDEGVWKQRIALGDTPVVWTTQIRPLRSKPKVLASVTVFEQSRLRAALYNGTRLPGGTGWKNWKKVGGAALPALVAAFNGGFEFRHIKGGYFTEGRTRKPLLNGHATLGIRPDGSMYLGVLGWDMFADGSWASLRQNLPPVVWQGQSGLPLATTWVYWGDDYGHRTSSIRSALCTRSDGRLMYVYVGMVDIKGLVSTLLALGCQTGMQLDMNGTWPQFTVFDQGIGTTARKGSVIDRRMRPWNRYITRSQKDFVALFDPALLPTGAVA